jgi:hypothetical protein
VGSLAFKAGGRSDPATAGSIPVHVRLWSYQSPPRPPWGTAGADRWPDVSQHDVVVLLLPGIVGEDEGVAVKSLSGTADVDVPPNGAEGVIISRKAAEARHAQEVLVGAGPLADHSRSGR